METLPRRIGRDSERRKMNYKILILLISGATFQILIPLLPPLFKTKIAIDIVIIAIAITITIIATIILILRRRKNERTL